MTAAPAHRPDEDSPALPDEAYAASLANLPAMGPARLAAILRVDDPGAAWARVLAGQGWADPAVLATQGPEPQRLVQSWRTAARRIDPQETWRRVRAAGVGVAVLGARGYPPPLSDDVEPPAVLFHRGTPEALLGQPRVAVVGTRRCSATGASVATELGRELAAAGVSVVSGLATGIDAGAHRGAVAARAAPPVGVVGSGLDVVYPPGQSQLWEAVADVGVLLSEAPPGARPTRWRFPARNRIIAALADVVVIVESHRRGGAFHTVDEADRRGVDVLAVPGSVRNPAAAGTNALLAEGRPPVTDVEDVLVALGSNAAPPRRGRSRRLPERDDDQAVLNALGWHPATLDQLALRSGQPFGALVLALDRLRDGGWVAQRGGWYERVMGEEA